MASVSSKREMVKAYHLEIFFSWYCFFHICTSSLTMTSVCLLYYKNIATWELLSSAVFLIHPIIQNIYISFHHSDTRCFYAGVCFLALPSGYAPLALWHPSLTHKVAGVSGRLLYKGRTYFWKLRWVVDFTPLTHVTSFGACMQHNLSYLF